MTHNLNVYAIQPIIMSVHYAEKRQVCDSQRQSFGEFLRRSPTSDVDESTRLCLRTKRRSKRADIYGRASRQRGGRSSTSPARNPSRRREHVRRTRRHAMLRRGVDLCSSLVRGRVGAAHRRRRCHDIIPTGNSLFSHPYTAFQTTHMTLALAPRIDCVLGGPIFARV
jgi:hypothetical protein